ncbi:hypothetical protein F4803DRAFT_162483 [Xylaria telfairii]|nr:hypothetical protein F4803DRAFT_162483 [Xylaria telfairii]
MEVAEVIGSNNTISPITQEPIEPTNYSPSHATDPCHSCCDSLNNQSSTSPELSSSTATSYTPELQHETSAQLQSTRSRSPIPGPPYRCKVHTCSKVFPNDRELQRHYKSRTHGQDLWDDRSAASNWSFKCACGKLDPRRDNHRRHVIGCQHEVTGQYRCDKGHTRQDKEQWLAHLEDVVCKPRRGRPPGSSTVS